MTAPAPTPVQTTVDPESGDFTANAAAMRSRLDEVTAAYATAVAGGGERALERHRARGKMTPRERIDSLLDRGSPFLELCGLAAWGSQFTVGASIVGGIGTVEGTECLLIANDSTVKGGTSNPWTLRKMLRLQEIALENRLPLINLVESGGADLPTQKEVFIQGLQGRRRYRGRRGLRQLHRRWRLRPRPLRPHHHDRGPLQGLPRGPATGQGRDRGGHR